MNGVQRLRPDAVFTGTELLVDHDVVVGADGRVAAVDARRDGADAAGGEVVDLAGRVLLPGLCDAHSHAFQRAFRGRVQHREGGVEGSFWTWREAMYRTANGLDPDGVEAVSALAFLELLRAGVTAVGEFHYLHHQPDGTRYADPDELAARVVAAARRVGLRVALLRVVYAAAGVDAAGRSLPLGPLQRRFGCADPDEALAACARLERRFGADAGVVVGLAPHSIRAVPRAWLPELATFAGVVHCHVAEQPAEVAASRAAFGCGPLRLLADAGLVGARFAAVHLTHPDPGDAALLAEAGAGVVVCPSTELDLGDGLLPLGLRQSARIAVGSDSYAAVEPLAEARAIELHGRALAGRRVLLGDGSRGALSARIVAMASANGHRALGFEGGRVAVGAPADLVAIDLRRPEACGVPALEAAALVSRPEWVSDVWVGGARVLEGGAHREAEAIVRAASAHIEAL